MPKRPYMLGSECSEKLYKALRSESDGRVLFGMNRPLLSDDHRNLYRLLLTKNGKRLLSLAADGEDTENGSDYDRFVELLKRLPLLAGSGYYSFVRLMLEYFFDLSELPASEDAAALWNASVSLLRGEMFEGLLSPFMTVSIKDVTSWVLPAEIDSSKYGTLETYVSAYKSDLNDISALSLDLTGFAFLSPDPYHAREGFAALCAERCDETARMYFGSQLLRITGELCKEKDIPLLITGDFSKSATEALLRYLEKADRLPKLLLCLPFDNAREADRRYRSAEKSGLLDRIMGVVPTNLPYCSVSAMKETLALSAMRYPLGKHCFLAEGSTEAEIRMGYERFVRLLSEFLSDMIADCDITEPAAVMLGKEILFGKGILS